MCFVLFFWGAGGVCCVGFLVWFFVWFLIIIIAVGVALFTLGTHTFKYVEMSSNRLLIKP